MTPRVATKSSWPDFSAKEIADRGREVERERELRLAKAATLGERVVLGAEFKQWVRNLPASDTARPLPFGRHDIDLAALDATETKTLLRAGSATSVGAFQSLDPSGEYAPPRRPLELLDLVRLGTTDEGAVPYMRQTTYSSAAVETAEATSTTTGTKPEASLPFEQVTSPVEEIPSWVPVTRRALADVDEMRGLIDEQLLYDARRRLEAQLLAGNGTSPKPEGPRRHHRRADTGEGR